jgi:hypothetical protein
MGRWITTTFATRLAALAIVAGGFACADANAPGETTMSPGMKADVKADELDHTQDIRGNCSINSGYADDHACIPAPKAEQGIQVHVGPSTYDDPDEVAKFIMKPGEESSECYTIRLQNTEPVVYQTYMLSGRAGTHHIINNLYEGELPTDAWGGCAGARGMDSKAKEVGALPGASKAFMARSAVAPEYEHVARTLPPNAILSADMHYFNFTDKDIVREFWLNLYTPTGEVTQQADIIRGYGGLIWNREPIMPGTDQVYKYECPISGNGSIMTLIGHYHAHGKRFTASLKRTNGSIDKVFEMYDYLDPAIFDYNTVTMNPEFTTSSSGAVSGPLQVASGDILQWECHIINDGDVPLRYTNEVKTGEMCNIWGYSVGTKGPIECDIFR